MEKNTVINEMNMQVKSITINEGLVRRAVGDFVNMYTNNPETLSDLKVAVNEAVTNCIIHAYPEEPGIIYVSAKIFKDGKVQIKIKDKGCGIENVKAAREALFSTRKFERAGLGFSVMESFMDKVEVKSTVNSGTTVTLEKKIELYE